MTSKRFLKRIHVCGTLWFLLCAATLLIISLYHAGFDWWLIFSISGYSAVLLFFIFTVYLFAVYQGVVRTQMAIEHPLSTSLYYTALYDMAPFLGAAAGLISLPVNTPWVFTVNTIAEGTLITTFVVWIIFDPIIGLVETCLPESAASRKLRLAQMRQQKQHQKEAGQKLLQELERRESDLQTQWNNLFEPMAKDVADLLCNLNQPDANVQAQIVELGALAWKTGGITCMRYFHQMILTLLQASDQRPAIDYPSVWWDGIGTWRKPQTIADWYIAA
jgi:hypothetical protein